MASNKTRALLLGALKLENEGIFIKNAAEELTVEQLPAPLAKEGVIYFDNGDY